MIKMLRIDDRLIHGQVAVVWSKNLNISRIMVISNKISKNEIQKSALQMAAPENIKTFILPVSQALDILNDPRAKNLSILVIMDNPEEVKEVCEGLNKDARPEILDMANYGRISGDLDTKHKITDTVYLTDEEKQIFETLSNEGFKFIYRPLPSDSAKDLDSLLK